MDSEVDKTFEEYKQAFIKRLVFARDRSGGHSSAQIYQNCLDRLEKDGHMLDHHGVWAHDSFALCCPPQARKWYYLMFKKMFGLEVLNTMTGLKFPPNDDEIKAACEMAFAGETIDSILADDETSIAL